MEEFFKTKEANQHFPVEKLLGSGASELHLGEGLGVAHVMKERQEILACAVAQRQKSLVR